MEFDTDFTPRIVHGDLKGVSRIYLFVHSHKILSQFKANIVMNFNGQPCLTDFGLSRMLEDHGLWQKSSSELAGSMRWQSYELLDGTQKVVTIESDIFAWARTVLVNNMQFLLEQLYTNWQEIMTGKVPFHEVSTRAVYGCVAVRHQLPSYPHDAESRFTVREWQFLSKCWRADPARRPSSKDLLRLVYAFNLT